MKLKHVQDRVIVVINMEAKNSHRFADGTTIRIERKYDCFNMRHVNPVNGFVVSGENIPESAEILIHHNSCHDTNRIFSYKQSSDIGDIRYFSIPVNECFAWYDKENKRWTPFEGFDFALRVFKPHTGILQVEPELVKNVLYITTGRYAGKVMSTLKASDYQIVYQDVNGREGNLIRVRTSDNKTDQREAETVWYHEEFTNKVKDGRFIVGLTKSDAKPLKEIQYA